MFFPQDRIGRHECEAGGFDRAEPIMKTPMSTPAISTRSGCARYEIGQRRGSPEPWKHAVVERGHGADPAKRDEDSRGRPVMMTVGSGWQVGHRTKALNVRARVGTRSNIDRANRLRGAVGHGRLGPVLEGHRWIAMKTSVGTNGLPARRDRPTPRADGKSPRFVVLRG